MVRTFEILIICVLTLAACLFAGCDFLKTEEAADRQALAAKKERMKALRDFQSVGTTLGISAVSDVVKSPVDWQDPRMRLELGIIQLEHLDKAIAKLTGTPALLSPYETHRALAAYYAARANILGFISMEAQNVEWQAPYQETIARDD